MNPNAPSYSAAISDVNVRIMEAQVSTFCEAEVVNQTHRRDTRKTIKSVKTFVETDVEPTDIFLQRALPLMARKLADMQNADSEFRREVLQEFGALHQKIDDLVSGRIPLWSLQEDGGERDGARSTEVQAFPVPANNSGPISQLPDIPVQYIMSRGVQTVPDLWRE
ncbi:hypothetical protein PHYBLDRAFT_170278 [Phycomyces blakesleeanus NRRL 1555(-)]|uniref:Uncharacterized protein n=1 Tax=Phycomyces blakesleeanus (strain ATCC 8743b / DSM 1359 / FGSC 10004 / NBRC 33097 / NRRL 1555) TaxID=763407 RepID=A0A167M301_PHYB8|nr:hypothetical protein PHYBLDRAFT_170278 [Phycomyces blakesleeanus NRRL 1555(-)]OAD71619.1 hypothetical protein PHYBLDRAFT_170278 [Phycomyces blakesleeanus NRRL 1555(-)]|eukprot:XP_018289659.1 hypothetical protein PHYBLDRAFT_170278 [Phycomyces blakesleeanus NRRL 1555(-)]